MRQKNREGSACGWPCTSRPARYPIPIRDRPRILAFAFGRLVCDKLPRLRRHLRAI